MNMLLVIAINAVIMESWGNRSVLQWTICHPGFVFYKYYIIHPESQIMKWCKNEKNTHIQNDMNSASHPVQLGQDTLPLKSIKWVLIQN